MLENLAQHVSGTIFAVMITVKQTKRTKKHS